jgi:pimeloyl-ACP methyl ester carboxylesterase
MRLLFLLSLACGWLLAQQPADIAVPYSGGSLSYFSAAPKSSGQRWPLLIVLGPGLERGSAKAALEVWRTAAGSRGWQVIAPYGQSVSSGDATVAMLEAVVKDVRGRFEVDSERIYLAASEAASPLAFYIASRAPHLVAAAVAIGGSPRDAIETNRLFGANTALDPVLWVVDPAGQASAEPLRSALKEAGFNVVMRSSQGFTEDAALEWLGNFRLQQYPRKADCETGNLAFGRCYWIRIARFDAGQRNDVLLSTRVRPGSGASLGLGGFGYRASAPGPGVLVEWLPEGYKGPLKLQDRIVALAGRTVEDAASYASFLDAMTEEKGVAVMVQRGKERLRLETKIVLPKREEALTARVQAEYFSDDNGLLVITRQIGEMRLDLPEYWIPAHLNWNGNDMGTANKPGCWVLSAGTPAARPCGP